MKRLLPSGLLLYVFVTVARACEVCRPQVRSAVYDDHFFGTLGLLAVPLLCIGLAGLWAYRSDGKDF